MKEVVIGSIVSTTGQRGEVGCEMKACTTKGQNDGDELLQGNGIGRSFVTNIDPIVRHVKDLPFRGDENDPLRIVLTSRGTTVDKLRVEGEVTLVKEVARLTKHLSGVKGVINFDTLFMTQMIVEII